MKTSALARTAKLSVFFWGGVIFSFTGRLSEGMPFARISGSRNLNMPNLKLRPVRAERIGRHASALHAGAIQALLDLRRNAVAALDLLFVQPHAHAILLQSRGHVAHHRTVFALWLKKTSNRNSFGKPIC